MHRLVHTQSAELTYLIFSQLAAHESGWSFRVTLTSYCALLEFVELTLDEAQH